MQCTGMDYALVNEDRNEASPRQASGNSQLMKVLAQGCRRVCGLVYRRALKEEIIYLKNKEIKCFHLVALILSYLGQ